MCFLSLFLQVQANEQIYGKAHRQRIVRIYGLFYENMMNGQFKANYLERFYNL